MSRGNLWRLWCAISVGVITLAPPTLAEDETALTAGDEEETQTVLSLDVPLYREVTIDGDAADWRDRGHAEVALEVMHVDELDAADLSGSMRLGWDERGLVVLVTVRDDQATEGENQATMVEMDSVELVLSDESADRNRLRFAITPGGTEQHPEMRVRTWDYRQDLALRRHPIQLQAASQRMDDGYCIEALIPWEAFGVVPHAGAEFGFSLEVHDADGGHRRDHLRWGKTQPERSRHDKATLNRLQLTPMHHDLVHVGSEVKPLAA